MASPSEPDDEIDQWYSSLGAVASVSNVHTLSDLLDEKERQFQSDSGLVDALGGWAVAYRSLRERVPAQWRHNGEIERKLHAVKVAMQLCETDFVDNVTSAAQLATPTRTPTRPTSGGWQGQGQGQGQGHGQRPPSSPPKSSPLARQASATVNTTVPPHLRALQPYAVSVSRAPPRAGAQTLSPTGSSRGMPVAVSVSNPLRRPVPAEHVGIGTGRHKSPLKSFRGVSVRDRDNAQTWQGFPPTAFPPFGSLSAWVVRALNDGLARDRSTMQSMYVGGALLASIILNALLIHAGRSTDDDECEEKLPTWCYTSGVTGMIQDVMFTLTSCLVAQVVADKKYTVGLLRLSQLLSIFSQIWNIVGAVWLFRIDSGSDTCVAEAFDTAFWTIVLWLVGLGAMPILYCIGRNFVFGDSKG